MTKVLKSSYTVKVVQGDDYEWEMEVFYFNHKSKQLEPVSPAPHSTPKSLKKPLGFLQSVVEVDSEILKVANSSGEEINLSFDKLSPLLDDTDSTMKKTLLKVKSSGCANTVNTLNKLIAAFHEPENKIIITSSIGISEEPRERRLCSNALKKVHTDSGVASSSAGGSDVETLSISVSRSRDSYKSSAAEKRKRSQPSSEERPSKKSNLGAESEKEEDDIFSKVEQIIRDAEYLNVKFQNIEIPNLVKIDAVKVAQLKESVNRFPDKTQTFVGLIRVVDEEGNQVGPYQCWVNAELYVALFELQLEADGEDSGCVLSIVHEVEGDGEVDTEVVGSFLLNNSKEFAAILHESINYQDLLRFACTTMSSDMSENSKVFLKRTLRGFTKGHKNAIFFIKFASLPVEYLNQFDKFCRLYEEGSLYGMKVSHRKRISLDKESKKKESCKLEIPLHFLKLHLKVDHWTREQLLDKLMKKTIGFKNYKEELMKASDLIEVKKQVARHCRKEFVEVNEKYPELVSDEALSEFCGASGQNNQYLKLARHLEEGTSSEVQKEGKSRPAAKVDFINGCKLSLSDTIKHVTAHDVVVMVKGKDQAISNREFAFKEHIKGKAAIGVFIDPSIKSVKFGLDNLEEDDIHIEAVHIKKAAPVCEDGFRREHFPVFVLGHSQLFKNKEIDTFFPYQLKDAIPLLLHQVTALGNKVLYLFEEDCHAFDVDPQGVLGRKNVSICYMSGEEALEKVADRLGRKKR